MDELPNTVETPPNMNTTTTFMGIEAKQLGAGGAVGFIGVLLGLIMNNLWFILPFGIIGVFVTFYKKEDLPIWEYGWRWMYYNFIESNFYEGVEECSRQLISVTELNGNYYKIGRNRYVAVLLVEGAPFHNLDKNQRLKLLKTFKGLLNSSSFDFPIQIIGKKGDLPLKDISPAPGLYEEECPYNEPLEYIGNELENHLYEIGDNTKAYYYHIVIPYYCKDEGNDELIEQRVESKLEERVNFLSQYLNSMGLAHRRLQGEELVDTLSMFTTDTTAGE